MPKKVMLCMLFALFILFIIYYRDCKTNTLDSYQSKEKPKTIIDHYQDENVSNDTNDTNDSVESNISIVGEQINNELKKNTRKEKELQKKYSLTYGTYKYNILEGEQPIQGLYVDYDREYETTLPKICNKMVVEPDLDFPYANLLSR